MLKPTPFTPSTQNLVALPLFGFIILYRKYSKVVCSIPYTNLFQLIFSRNIICLASRPQLFGCTHLSLEMMHSRPANVFHSKKYSSSSSVVSVLAVNMKIIPHSKLRQNSLMSKNSSAVSPSSPPTPRIELLRLFWQT